MKTLFSFLALCIMTGLFTSAAADEVWTYYYIDKSNTKYYYDSKSVVQPSKNIARVWSKYIISKEAKDAFPTLPKEVKSYTQPSLKRTF